MHKLALAHILFFCPASLAAQTLSQQVAAAKPGATIVASAAGEVLDIKGRSFNPPVTITGGRLSKVTIKDSAGLSFNGVTFERTPGADKQPLFYAQNSSRISVTNSTFRGGRDFNGVNLRTVTSFSITDSTFANLLNGLRGVNVNGMSALRNSYADIAIDGVGFGGARNVEIAESAFRSNDTNKAGHPDAIQLWDEPGIASTDIIIRDNLVDVQSQGIFVKSEKRGGFDRVQILRNDVRTAYANAIWLSYARDSRIEGNRIRTRTNHFHMAKLAFLNNERLTLADNKVCKINDVSNIAVTRTRLQLGWECPK